MQGIEDFERIVIKPLDNVSAPSSLRIQGSQQNHHQ